MDGAHDGPPCLSPHTGVEIVPPSSLPDVDDAPPNHDKDNTSMVYNDFGELVNAQTLRIPPKSTELSVTQNLRFIKRAFNHKFREIMGVMLIPQSNLVKDGWTFEDSGQRLWRGPLTIWDFTSPEPEGKASRSPSASTPDGRRLANSDKPPRVLELGCSEGHWCYKLKKENPTWIVEGLDDTDHWSCIPREGEVKPRDFMEPYSNSPENRNAETEDYFEEVREQDGPEFTKRDLNRLRDHEKPIAPNTYGLIRGRDVFDRVQSYKTFIEDLREILQPGGVVEFSEIDPRPRLMIADLPDNTRHVSQAETDWTNKIADRFRDPTDAELVEPATKAPGWVGRVNERLKASMRPRDGVPAANLKSWLQGGGFWDVNQTVIPLPVGGGTRAGALMIDFIKYQIGLENEIPKLKEELPEVELEHILNGGYHINLHLVSGRKPHEGRMGDLRADGTRELMTEARYDRMARFSAEASGQWQRTKSFRFDLDVKLADMLGNLSTLHGGLKHIGPPLESTGTTPTVASPIFTPPGHRSLRGSEM